MIQISAFIESAIASVLGSGSVAIVTAAQMIYTLPVSLFSMSVSASELPEMSSATGTKEEIAKKLQLRICSGLQRISFFVVPSSVAFFALGEVVAAALFQTGKFDAQGVRYVWATLCGSSFGLLASTFARYIHRHSMHFMIQKLHLNLPVRVSLGASLSFSCYKDPVAVGDRCSVRTAFAALSSGIAGWCEYTLLRKTLNKIRLRARFKTVIMLYSAAISAAICGWGVKPDWRYRAGSSCNCRCSNSGVYGVVYFLAGSVIGIKNHNRWLKDFSMVGISRRGA